MIFANGLITGRHGNLIWIVKWALSVNVSRPRLTRSTNFPAEFRVLLYKSWSEIGVENRGSRSERQLPSATIRVWYEHAKASATTPCANKQISWHIRQLRISRSRDLLFVQGPMLNSSSQTTPSTPSQNQSRRVFQTKAVLWIHVCIPKIVKDDMISSCKLGFQWHPMPWLQILSAILCSEPGIYTSFIGFTGPSSWVRTWGQGWGSAGNRGANGIWWRIQDETQQVELEKNVYITEAGGDKPHDSA